MMIELVREILGERFTVACVDAVVPQANGLLNAIEKMAAQGCVFKDADIFDFGGVPFVLKRRGDGLTVGRPRFDEKDSVGASDDLSSLLLLVFHELSFVRRVGVEPEQVGLMDKVVFEDGCLSAPDVFMERCPDVPPGDSGWFIGSVDEVGDERALKAMCVWQLLRVRPLLVRAMALPSRFLVVWSGDNVVSVVGPDGNEVWRPK